MNDLLILIITFCFVALFLNLTLINFLLIATAIFFLLGGNFFGLLFLLISLVSLIAKIILKKMTASHQNKLTRNLPQILQKLSLYLKTGSSLEGAIRQTKNNLEEHWAIIFDEITHQLNMGRSPEETLEDFEGKLAIPLFSKFVYGVKLARETGLDLSLYLENLSQEGLQENQFHEKIQAFSAQGRMQGWILSLMPLVLLVGLYFLDPGRVKAFIMDPRGQILIGMVFLLEITGILWIRRLMKF